MFNFKSFIELQDHIVSESLFSMKDNWHLFKQYLNDPIVVESLVHCLGFNDPEEWDQDEDAPWTYSRSDYWSEIIQERMEADIEFTSALKLIFESMHGAEANMEDDDMWDDIYSSQAYRELEKRFGEKYRPQKGEIEWYQWKHGCFAIAPFVSVLLKTAITDAQCILILTSKTHSVAAFIKNNNLYFADLLVEWSSVQELNEFMGEITKVTLLSLFPNKARI